MILYSISISIVILPFTFLKDYYYKINIRMSLVLLTENYFIKHELYFLVSDSIYTGTIGGYSFDTALI